MTNLGLNTRLRQRSRRAGIMIGISMAITIALCVGSFSIIYSALEPFTQDFVSDIDPTPTESDSLPQPTATSQPESSEDGDTEQNTDDGEEPEPTEEPDDSGDNQIQDSNTEDFTPDYQISAGQTVNFRSGPGTSFEPVTTLTPEEPLQHTGNTEEPENPGADGLGEGQVWMEFVNDEGDTGWVREIDVEPYDPDA